MVKPKEISVVKRLGSAIYNTGALQEFLDEISKYPDKEVKLDFSKVDFISRACAEEYLMFMDEEGHKEKFKAVNFTPVVNTMIQQVRFRTRPEGEVERPKLKRNEKPEEKPEEEVEENEEVEDDSENETEEELEEEKPKDEEDPDEEELTYDDKGEDDSDEKENKEEESEEEEEDSKEDYKRKVKEEREQEEYIQKKKEFEKEEMEYERSLLHKEE